LIKEFKAEDPYRISRNVNPETGEFRLVVHIDHEWQHIWSILIGEFIHNLRSALDHMVYELVRLKTRRPPPDLSRTQFPVFLLEFENKPAKRHGFYNSSKAMLVGVGDDARALIVAEQPFKTGEGNASPLWHLHELSNWDKHRSISMTHALTEQVSITVNTKDIRALYGRPVGPIENGTILGGGFITSRDRPLLEWIEEVDVKADFTAKVAFANPRAVKGLPIEISLAAMGSRTLRIVNRIYEAIFEKAAT
jgi:hypothetical protein